MSAEYLNLERKAIIEFENAVLVAGVTSDLAGVRFLTWIDTTGEMIRETLLDERFPAKISLFKSNESYVALLLYNALNDEGYRLLRIDGNG